MIVRLNSQAPPDRARLLCFPHGGGSAGNFRHWVKDVPAGVGLYSIELPGRGARYRERNFTRVGDLVAAIHVAVSSVLDRDYVLFGHSLGARIAFALAERLRAEGRPGPQRLAVAGGLPPDRTPARDVSDMSEDDFLSYLAELGGTPPEALENPELMAYVSQPLRADMLLAQQILPVSGLLDCPLLVLGGRDDREVTYEDLERWQHVTRGPVRLQMFPGGHFFVETMHREIVDLLLDGVAPQSAGARRPDV